MPLAPGTRLGVYEVLALIGAGGMGEVYKARDTRLDRSVAIKISQEQFSERFEREVRAIATLNHPHICTLHDVGPNYLVMEYIDGTPLKGPLPLDQALQYATQIADALDAAHKQHITHRDLKPANILVTKAGVKLLDFGLAKRGSGRSGGSGESGGAGEARGLSAVPTEQALTAQGTILGTLQYMSPEQLQGRDADARSDIFSFGLVLYEMLTGRRAFEESSPASVIGAILERPAPVIEPERLHRGVNRVIGTCLAKDPDDRFQTARDLKRAIEWDASANEPATPAPPASKAWIAWAAAAVICAALAVIGWLRPQPAAGPAADLALTIAPPSASGIAPVGSYPATPEISPDGSQVTYHDRSNMLHLRRLNAISSEPLRGTIGVFNLEIWSPDSKTLVFADANTLKRMRVPDGAPEVIGRIPGPMLGGTISDSGTLLFASVKTKTNLYMLPPSGGEAMEITVPGLKEGSSAFPEFLPGSEDFLFGFVPQGQGSQDLEIYLATLRDGRPADPVLLFKNGTMAQYTPAGGGRVLFVRNDNLYAQTLNRQTRRLEGEAELVEQGVASGQGAAHFSVSRTGVLAWRPGRAALSTVTMFDRQGKEIGTAGPASSFILSVKLSPDERRLLVASNPGAWLVEPNQPGRLMVTQESLTMQWSPDGSQFLVPQPSRIVARPVSGLGDGRELASAPGLDRLEDVSADGSVVLFTGGALASSVFSLRLEGTPQERVPKPVLQTGEQVWNTRFSPDARWIVYQVGGQGGGIYVQQFPGPGLRRQVTRDGEYPVWRRDGREIVYLHDGRVWSLPVNTSDAEFRAGAPQPLFSVRPSPSRVLDVTQLAVSRDGSRIYFPQAVEQPDSDVIHVRMGWAGAAPRGSSAAGTKH